MSQGNYSFLRELENQPHVVTSYWKRLLRDMKEPLIPYEVYEIFQNLGGDVQDLDLPTEEADDIMFNVGIKQYLKIKNMPKAKIVFKI